MDYLIVFFVYTSISWILLLVVLPLARNIVDFSLPPMGELAWRAAVVAGAAAITDIVLSPVSVMLSAVAGFVVYYGLMYKLFDSGLFSTFVIAIMNALVVYLLAGLVLVSVMN